MKIYFLITSKTPRADIHKGHYLRYEVNDPKWRIFALQKTLKIWGHLTHEDCEFITWYQLSSLNSLDEFSSRSQRWCQLLGLQASTSWGTLGWSQVAMQFLWWFSSHSKKPGVAIHPFVNRFALFPADSQSKPKMQEHRQWNNCFCRWRPPVLPESIKQLFWMEGSGYFIAIHIAAS